MSGTKSASSNGCDLDKLFNFHGTLSEGKSKIREACRAGFLEFCLGVALETKHDRHVLNLRTLLSNTVQTPSKDR
jgi:hypothetical protein